MKYNFRKYTEKDGFLFSLPTLVVMTDVGTWSISFIAFMFQFEIEFNKKPNQ